MQLDVIREDPADNRILECAVAAGSDYIVTGDKVLAAAGKGAILAGQAEPHRESSMAVSGDSVAW